jgi:AcrR family transcriptional regulator
MTVPNKRARARRERFQELARGDILDAALKCFADSGYAQTKIADIAAAAGYTAASLYTYFPGKKEIFVAAADHFISGVERAVGEVARTPPSDFEAFADDVRTRIRRLCKFGDERSDVLAFFLRMRWSGEDVLEEIRGRNVECGAASEGADDDPHGPFRLHRHMTRIWSAIGIERFGISAIARSTTRSFSSGSMLHVL